MWSGSNVGHWFCFHQFLLSWSILHLINLFILWIRQGFSSWVLQKVTCKKRQILHIFPKLLMILWFQLSCIFHQHIWTIQIVSNGLLPWFSKICCKPNDSKTSCRCCQCNGITSFSCMMQKSRLQKETIFTILDCSWRILNFSWRILDWM